MVKTVNCVCILQLKKITVAAGSLTWKDVRRADFNSQPLAFHQGPNGSLPEPGKAIHYSGWLHSEVLLEPFWHIPGDSERSGNRSYREIPCLVTVMGCKNERGFHGR